jgi:hypothetical protein
VQYIAVPYMDQTTSQVEWKKGSAEFLILSLVEARPRHGYEISKLIEQRSRGSFSRRLALPAALPSGTPRLAVWTLGRTKRTAPSPLLSFDASGAQSPRFAASRLARIRSRYQSHHGGRKCLNGSQKFSAALLH